MYNAIKKTGLIVMAMLFSATVSAETLSKENIPEKIVAQLLKRHDKAEDITAEKKVHFSQELYRISFKEGEQKTVEFYRPNGHFYAGGDAVESVTLMVPGSEQSLKNTFKDYQIKSVILIVNPNGAGEEYDADIAAEGQSWSVVINNAGNILKKEKN